jgi:hypothetical protein
MYGTIFEKVQTLLSRTFWLGNFFPVFVFALLNLAIAWLGVDGFAAWLAKQWTDVKVFSAVPAFGLIAIGILAFVLAPLIPVFRKALEGELLSQGIIDTLKAECTEQANALQAQVRAAKEKFAFFDREPTNAKDTFRDARQVAGPRNDYSPASSDAAKAAFDALIAAWNAGRTQRTYNARLPQRAIVERAVRDLRAALAQYPMQPDGNPVLVIAEGLDQMQRELQDTLQFFKDIAGRNLQRKEAEFRTSFVLSDIKPTLIGNARAAMEQYPAVAYFADFNFLWPRMRIVLAKDDAISSAVDAASAQLDFAVLMTVLSLATAIAWLILLPFLGSSIVLYCVVGIVLPALVPFFYWLVAETQQAFGGVMEMAVDGLRFRLLSALRLPLPVTLEAEQRTWRNLQTALYSGLDTGIRFRQPKS